MRLNTAWGRLPVKMLENVIENNSSCTAAGLRRLSFSFIPASQHVLACG
jgi:hypothetical protein